jgi:hypothetical protein
MQAIDGSGSVQYGYTRLATNVGRPDLGVPTGSLDHQGFAAGLVEATSGTGQGATVYGIAGTNLGDVRIVSRSGNREFDATVRVDPRAPGEIFADGLAAPPPTDRVARSLAFGADRNGVPTTAVASQGTFAGVIPNQAALASVDRDLMAGIQNPGGLAPSNEHVGWGFFLGDLVANANGGPREYANLGFWVAGRPVDYATLQSLTGVASYQGGMIGNVVDGGGLRTATGAFSHRVDFGARTGSFGANFDGAGFGVGTGLNGASNVFSGSGPGDHGRTLSVQGTFFHNPATGGAVSPSNLPRATGGVFGVTGPTYGANGIFVGARP